MSRLHDDAFGLNKDNDELDNEKPSTSKCTNEEFESNLENSNIDNTGEMQRFKMLFNKHGHDLESRKASKNEEKQKKENRYAMIFNKGSYRNFRAMIFAEYLITVVFSINKSITNLFLPNFSRYTLSHD
jgi:hypothetical protein